MPVDITATDSAYYYVYQGEQQFSRHSTYHKAIEAAVNASEACRCLVLVRQDSTTRVVWTPAEPDSEPAQVEVTWAAPTEREDGTALLIGDICCYKIKQISSNGEVIHEAGNDYIYTISVEPGVHQFQVATVDTDKLQSAWSNSVEVLVE